MQRSLLALDLGTRTGWALGGNHCELSGVLDLKPKRFEGGGMRFVRFRNYLDQIVPIDSGDYQIAFEEVRRHAGTDAAHVYGGLMATLTSWCEERAIPYEGIPVGTIKKAWTGKGNATKNMMIAEAVRRGYMPTDDNEADAIAIWHFVHKREIG